jgi:hypothetical protein
MIFVTKFFIKYHPKYKIMKFLKFFFEYIIHINFQIIFLLKLPYFLRLII